VNFNFVAIELQFDRTTYTVFEDEERENEIVTVTKGGVISEQVLMGVIRSFPGSARQGNKSPFRKFV